MGEHRYKDFVGRIDVEAFIDDHEILGAHEVKQNKHGETEYIGQCPDPWGLHKSGDTTGKFALNVDKKVYNCWVCQGGSLLSLCMAITGLDVDQATDYLREYADGEHEVSDDRFMDEMDALLGQLTKTHEPEVLPYFNPHVLDKWPTASLHLLAWNEGEFDGKPKNIDWLTLSRYGVRFAPNVIKHAPRDKRTGIPIDDAYEGPAVIFPHYVGERLVGWQHRWLEDDRPKWCQKYTNTPEFPKSTTVYRVGDAHHLPVVVVESVPTALYVAGLGWPAVATFGGTITPGQLKCLRAFQVGVILAPDNDKPGVRGVMAAADYLDGFIPVSLIFPEGAEEEDGFDLMDRANVLNENITQLIRSAERIS